MVLRKLLLVVVLALVACTDEGASRDDAGAEGPPEVQTEVVDRHARQFDEEIPRRPAGSQQEFAAATYLTGHLQKAGYLVRLDAVPVANTVRSTNVVARPPGGSRPAIVVTVPYDTTTGTGVQGEDLGLFLEVARAVRVADPDHATQFVALGAEFETARDGHLGARRLIRVLLDEEQRPLLMSLAVAPTPGFSATGARSEELNAFARRMEIPPSRPFSDRTMPALLEVTEIAAQARLDHVIVSGGVDELGRVLVEWLQTTDG